MKIQEGCDRYCSYCIIPSVRGPVRSMPLEAVAAEAARLGRAGYREIVVTGIHLASYGRGTAETLMDAIRAVHDAPGVRRVRLGSLEPVTVTEDFARKASELPGLMRHFHLSLQSGSAGVLKRMRRRYTPGEYRAAVETLRRFMPDCAVTTDVITGFPAKRRRNLPRRWTSYSRSAWPASTFFLTPGARAPWPTPCLTRWTRPPGGPGQRN